MTNPESHLEWVMAVTEEFAGQHNVIPIPRTFVDWLGDYNCAALLNQVIYWSSPKRNKRASGWFYKSNSEWYTELGLTEYQIRRATKVIVEKAGVETKRGQVAGQGTPNFYRLDRAKFSESYLKFLQDRNRSNLGIEAAQTTDTYTDTTSETNNRENDTRSGMTGSFDNGDLHHALTDMRATGDMRTDDIPRTSSVPCTDPVIATVKVDTFDSVPRRGAAIVPGQGGAPARGKKHQPPATQHPTFLPTVAAIKAGYPLRDGVGPTEDEIIDALALVEPAHYPAIVASLPVYAKGKNAREGVVRNIATYLDKKRWEAYQPKAVPVISKAPSAVDEIERRRRAARAQKEQ